MVDRAERPRKDHGLERRPNSFFIRVRNFHRVSNELPIKYEMYHHLKCRLQTECIRYPDSRGLFHEMG